MIKKIAYILIPACAATISVASAETIPSNPTLLTAGEMDQVTAGLAGDANASAYAYSPIVAFTKTYTTAMAAANGNNLPGGAVAAGGIAVAGGVGEGSSASTSTSVTTDQSGPNDHVIAVNINTSGQLVNLSGSAVVIVSPPTVIPF